MIEFKQPLACSRLNLLFYGHIPVIKRRVILCLACMMIFWCSGTIHAQNQWTQKADFAGDGRGFAFSFAIGNKVYLGTGADVSFMAKNDFWEYDTETDGWSRKANFAGGARFGAVAFTLNGKGYVGLGNDAYGPGFYKDIWEYDPIGDDWTQLTDFAGAARQGAAVFVIAGKAYIGMGQGVNPSNPMDAEAYKDLWLFDPGDPQVWSQKSSLPAAGRYFPAAFSIGATGYLGGGTDDGGVALADFWQYNALADSWSRKADLGGGPKAIVSGVSVNGKGYVGFSGLLDFWQYNPATDSWSQKASIITERFGATTVSANGKIFVGTGFAGTPLKDFYEYTPEPDAVFAGKMYGATAGGGMGFGNGVIFRASATGTGVTSIYNFDLGAINGTSPGGALIELNGKLYGTTATGGQNTAGVLYQVDLEGNVYTRIVDFNNYNSVGARAGLTFAGGKLYGTARGGSGDPHGFIFEFDPATNTFAKKAPFNGANGSDPYGGELLLVGDKLYGVTMSGGANGVGVIFEYNFRSNVITKRADFNGANGSQPRSGLTEFSGMLYGMTPTGGSSDKGVLYEFDMTSGVIVKRKDFAGNDGELPYGGLTVVNDKLYGVTSDLGTGYTGVIFEYNPATQLFTKKFDFNNTSAWTGSDPTSTMTLINGKLYGTALLGGIHNKGALFTYDISGGFSLIFDFDDTHGAYAGSPVTFVRDNQTLTFNPLPAKVIGDAPFALTATGSLGLPVQFYSSNEGVATISGSTVTITGVGTTTITAYIGGGNHFTAVNRELVVNKKEQTITFAAPGDKTFGDGSFAVNATASSGLAVSYSSDNTAVATVSGNTITIVGAGTATIKATQPGNAAYHAAPEVSHVLTVAKADQVITFGVLPEKRFGDLPFELSATSTSNLAITFESADALVGSVSGTTLTVGNAGTATVTARQAGNANYHAATPVSRTLTVAKAFQEIAFSELPAKTLGESPFILSGTARFGTPTYTSSNPAVATVSGATVTITGAGQTEITASFAGNTNVLPAESVVRTLTVKASQVITFDPLGTLPYTSTLQLNATASSGLPVAYSSGTPSVASVSGSTLVIHGIGTTTITASQPGNATVHAAAGVDRVLTVTKADQTLTFDVIGDRKVGDANFDLNATSTSGLTVAFSTTSDKIQISGTRVTILAAGSVSINATQPGNAVYHAAAAVQRSFCVAPAKPEISLSNDNTGAPVLHSSAATGNQWYWDDAPIPGAVNQALTIPGVGVYKVRASVEGCVSEFSANYTMVITGLERSETEKIALYPNPVENTLIVAIPGNNGSNVSLLRKDGTVFQRIQNASGVLGVDVSTLPPGLYLLSIENNGSKRFGKFIKK